jgi:hypothetical protein
MAQTGFTPIQLYYSSTASAAPNAANLIPGELALNTADGKLFFKNSSGAVTLLANSTSAGGNLPGGTAGAIAYQSAPNTTTFLPLGTNNFILTSNGSVPVYTNPASITVGTAASAGFATTAGSATSATTATTATNLAGGSAFRLAFQSGPDATTFAIAPTSGDVGKVLSWTGTTFTWASAPAATTASNLAGGAQYQVPFQSGVGATAFSSNLTFNSATNTLSAPNVSATAVTADTVTGTKVVANGPISASANFGAFNYGTISYSDTNIFEANQTSVNSYAQKIMQNTSNGDTASVDYIISNDLGTATTYYGNFGMNSSGYAGVGPFQAPNAVYLFSVSTDLVVGTKTSNYLRFVTNDNAADSVTIAPNSAVAFNGNYGVAGQILQSNGTAGAPTWLDTATIGTSNGKLYFFGQF